MPIMMDAYGTIIVLSGWPIVFKQINFDVMCGVWAQLMVVFDVMVVRCCSGSPSGVAMVGVACPLQWILARYGVVTMTNCVDQITLLDKRVVAPPSEAIKWIWIELT